MKIKKPICQILVIIVLLLSKATLALAQAHIIPATDGTPIKVDISSYEHSRIRIEGGRIDYYTVMKGALIIQYEEIKGEIFVNLPPVNYYKNDEGKSVPISLYITSDSGATYQLLLHPKAVSGKQIFLVEQSAKDKRLRIYDNYTDQILSFYKSLYSGKSLKDYKVSYKKLKTKKDKLKITRIATYQPKSENGLYGEIFEIKNESKDLKILKPQDFFEEGIKAIKLDSHLLEEGEATKIYIISIKG